MTKGVENVPHRKDKMTSSETKFLRKHWYPKKESMKGPRTFVVVDGEKITKLAEFLGRCIDAFAAKFPYRHPETNPAQIPKELRHLQYSQSEWPGTIRERLRNKFNDFSRQKRDRRKSGLPSEEDDENESESDKDEEVSDDHSEPDDAASASGEEEMYIPEEEDRNEGTNLEQDIPEASRPEGAEIVTVPLDERDTGKGTTVTDTSNVNRTGHAALAASVAARKVFQPNETTYDSWEYAFKQLGEMGAKSWAECDPQELKSRQENVPNIIHNVLDLLYYTTGYELYATGVVLSKEQAYKFHTTTPRAQHFSEHPDGKRSRDSFVHFVNSYIGPGLCTNTQCPAPAIYPDPRRENHPTYPAGIIATHEQRQCLLADYLAYKSAWQGGGASVPYDLLFQQHEEGRQDIIENRVLPPGVKYLKNPMLMEPEELEVMISHIIARDQNKVPADRNFRFEQISPGMFASNYPAGQYPQAVIVYRPDSQAYSVVLEEHAHLTSSPRADGLPTIGEYEEPYCSFTEGSIATYRAILRPDDRWWGLLEASQRHDKLFPAQATSMDWDRMSAFMPHILRQRPFPASAGDHIVSDSSWLPKQYFDWRAPDHQLWSLLNGLHYCRPERWMHLASGTILGGPFGVKWALVFLGHLKHNIHRYVDKQERWVSHYAKMTMEVGSAVRFTFEPGHVQQVDATIEILHLALQESAQQLEHEYSPRRITIGHESAMRNAVAAHCNIPTSPEQFENVHQAPGHDPWDDTLSDVEKSAWYEHPFADTSAKMPEPTETPSRNIDTSILARRAPKRAAPAESSSPSHVRRRTTNESGEEDEDMDEPDEGDVKGKARETRPRNPKTGNQGRRVSGTGSRSGSIRRGSSKGRN